MKIAIIGYGKMGKMVEIIAKKRNHKISLCYDKTPPSYLLKRENIDVAIEFSQPNSAFNNIKSCIERNIPVVSGTTGWIKKIDIIKKICERKRGSFLYSSNFSIGVNFFKEANKKLAVLLKPYSNEYKIKIEEIHHKEKLDKPSGTSISLAKDIIYKKLKKEWKPCDYNNDNNIDDKNNILIYSKRINNVSGIHSIVYSSEIEEIKMQHKAYNRSGFAFGAVIASEWIINKKGFFSMKDVLNLK